MFEVYIFFFWNTQTYTGSNLVGVDCRKLEFLKLILKIFLKKSAHVDGGRAEGLACADPGARTPSA